MPATTRSPFWRARTLGAAALCALAGHAALYLSLWPGGGGHGYLGWYEAALGTAVLVALAGLAALVAVPGRLRRRLAASPGRSVPVRDRARVLTGLALAWLAGQEAAEHLAAGGSPNVAPSAWLLAVIACLVAALVVAWAERGAHAVLAGTAAAPRPRAARATGLQPLVVRSPRRRPIALHRALRAPPALLA
jgi:hypothetical protein